MNFAGGLEAGGWAVWPLIALAVPGLAFGVLALGLSQKRTRHYFGLAALTVSSVLSILAIVSSLSIRNEGKIAEESSKSETSAIRLRRAVAIHSRIPLRIGLGAALIPLLGGVTGALSIRRSRKGKPQSVRSLRAPVVPSKTMPLAIALSVVAGGGALGAAVLLLSPLPGPRIPIESNVWDCLEAIEQMRAGQSSAGCDALEKAALRGGADTKAVPEITGAVAECFQLRFDEATSTPPLRESELLEKLNRSPLPITRDDRTRLDAERRALQSRLPFDE